MADYKDLPNGRQDAVLTHDEADGTFSRSVASHLRGWDSTDGAWYRLPVDHATGALKVQATLAAGSVDIGIVDQGTGGSSAWKVTDLALTDGSQRVGGTVALAAETTKVIGVTRSADGAGNLLTSTTNALDINIKSGNPTAITANAGTNLNTSALALDATLTGGNVLVQGNVASLGTDSGNPVKVAGKYVAAGVNVADGKRIDLQMTAQGMLQTSIMSSGGSSVAVGSSQSADGLASNFTTFSVLPFPLLFNATTWDRARGNFNTTTGDTGAKSTAAFLGATQTNYNARGAIITCLLGTVTGAVTTWQTGIQWSYDGGTTWLELTPLGANDTAAASGRTYTWIIYPTNTSQAAGTTPATLVPGTISVAGPTQLNVVNAALPRTWRFAAQVSVATSITITSVNVNYIL